MIVLLILALILSGCAADREIMACLGGWFEFTCRYSDKWPNYPTIVVHNPTLKNLGITEADKWQENQDFFLYHNSSVNLLRVLVKNFQKSGDYWCKFGKKKSPKLEVEQGPSCTQLRQTVYELAKATVTCISDSRDGESFFCKDGEFDCVEIVSKRSPESSDGRFTLTKIERGFNVSISNVSSQDGGVYWCGVKPADGFYRSVTRIQLDVQSIETDTRSATIGGTLRYNCSFSLQSPIKKFFCKGENPSQCKQVVNSANRQRDRFSLRISNLKNNISIIVEGLQMSDSGVYWCGADNLGKDDVFVHRLVLTVEPRAETTPSTQLTTASSASTASAARQGDFPLPVISAMAAVTCAAALVLSVLIYRRCRNSIHEEAQNEDHHYAEIEERPQKPDSGTAPLYVMASFPTAVSASHYSNALFENRGSAPGDGVPGPTYSTVNHPSNVTDKPLYSKNNFTIDRQQH